MHKRVERSIFGNRSTLFRSTLTKYLNSKFFKKCAHFNNNLFYYIGLSKENIGVSFVFYAIK